MGMHLRLPPHRTIPCKSRQGNPVLHRALFYHEQEGYLETFRPYAPPHADWLRRVAENQASQRS